MNPLQILYSVIAAVVIGGVGWYIYDCESKKTDFAVFKSNVELLGKKAKEEADRKETANKLAKEKADAQNQKLRANNAALTKRLHDARARSGFLPAPAPAAKRPDILAFDRTELDGALRRLDAGVSGLVAEGDQARIDLDTVREWSNSVLLRHQ